MFSYICPEIVEAFKFKSGDVVVSVPAKCGTHWCMFLAYSILSRGDCGFVDIYERVPWLEFKWSPEQTVEDRVEFLEKRVDYGLEKNRIFKTHLDVDPGPLPFLPEVKYIFCFRNPLDVVISVHSFLHMHTDEFFHHWGMEDLKTDLKGIDDAIDLMCKGIFPKNIFKAFERAWNLRDRKNVLLVHFSDLKKDLSAEIERMSKFLELQLSDHDVSIIEEHCSFGWMKDQEQKFNLNSLGVVLKDGTKIPILKNSGLLRKGGVREHLEVLSVDQQQKIWEYGKSQGLEPELLNFIFQ